MLVAIEGIDGAGKNTQTQFLTQSLRDAGLSVENVSFPAYGRTFFGAAIRELLRGSYGTSNDPRLIGLLFAGDRLELRKELERSLTENDVVIADRYVASNLAYQGGRASESERESVINWLAHVEYEVYKLPRADITVLLDVPVSLAAVRMSSRPESGGRVTGDIFERDIEYLRQCRSCYLMMARENGWVTVPSVINDSSRTVSDIAAQVKMSVFEALEPKHK